MLVQWFQATPWLNVDNKYTRFLSRAAYTVYLIHPLVVTSVSAIFVQIVPDITFANTEPAEVALDSLAPPGEGGEEYYVWGWIFVNVLTQVIVWPLAWYIANMPYLRTFL